MSVLPDEAVRRPGTSRWLLVGPAATVLDVAAEVLSGRLPVFGLAGVVVTDAGPPDDRSPGLPGLPTLRTTLAGADEAVERFWEEYAGRGPDVPSDYAAMLASDRVTTRTRAIMARRALADDPHHRPVALDAPALDALRAVADRVVPQDGDTARHIDLAVRTDVQLAEGRGDGWRFDDLPPDVEAYRAALAELSDLTALGVDAQDAALAELAAGRRTPRLGVLSGEQLAHWFEDACVDLVRHWLAHPGTLARVGFDGLASGGDAELLGFVELGPGREAWEPTMGSTP